MGQANGRQSIFITGAASGMGLETARLFAGKGWFVGGVDVNEPGLAALEVELGGANCLIQRLDVTDREAYRAGERQSLELFAADTLATADLFGKRRFDVIVTDAPYGVTHGSRAGGARAGGPAGGRDRSPGALLEAAVPVWVSVLRTGGALGIAWNTHGLSRADLAAICTGAGLTVCDDGPYLELAHRVDAGIRRDVLVARKV